MGTHGFLILKWVTHGRLMQRSESVAQIKIFFQSDQNLVILEVKDNLEKYQSKADYMCAVH
jgi:hypothetical protein